MSDTMPNATQESTVSAEATTEISVPEALQQAVDAMPSWIEGANNHRPWRDVFTEFDALEGELTDEVAKATLAEFLFHNPRFLFDILGGIQLFPMQELMLKGWAQNDYNLGVMGRGVSKTWMAALFALFWAMFNPGTRVVVLSHSFRQSRAILTQDEKFIADEGADRLRANFPNGVRHTTDEWILDVPNRASIRCLPLGDGTKIRGVRADVLIVDEFAYLPESIINEILRPFLASKSRIKEQRKLDELQDTLIKAGDMTEDERVLLEDRKKVIFLSSACFQFEHMYQRYKDWTGKLLLDPKSQQKDYDAFKESGRSYFIARLGWEAAPKGLLDMEEIEQAKKETSEAMFNREYGAQFTSDSGGYFKMSKMVECSVKDGEEPCLELEGVKGDEYVVSIDTSSSGAEDSDHFAICVFKMFRKPDKSRIPMLVHSYALAGGNLKDHILYFYYILTRFNVVYIATDASQGDNVEFLNSSIQSKLFKDAGLNLCDIEVDFKREEGFKDLPKEIKLNYNRTLGRIIQKQSFSPGWQRTANEWLQACFDHKGVMFAAKIGPNSGVAGRVINTDLSILQHHTDFKDTSTVEFIDMQDMLLDMTRKECATIVVSVTDTGHQQFKLPQNVRRTSGPNRLRKDSYSAFLLGVWACKLYLESLTIEVQVGPKNFPYWTGG